MLKVYVLDKKTGKALKDIEVQFESNKQGLTIENKYLNNEMTLKLIIWLLTTLK